jgi:hypothetical protein
MPGNNEYKYSPERLQERINAYFKAREGQRTSKADLCVWLDISLDTWGDYRNNRDRGNIIKRAETKLIADLELSANSQTTTKDIFLLKAQFGLQDTQRVEQNTQVHVVFDAKSLAKIAK